jgi:hypothetical protein
VYGEENNIVYWADWSSQGRTKIFYTGIATSESNEATKEGPISFVLVESPLSSVATVSRGHPSLVPQIL